MQGRKHGLPGRVVYRRGRARPCAVGITDDVLRHQCRLGPGADFGGLAGADKHCQALATAVGAGDKTWRAYLSTQGPGAAGSTRRDRIGKGPWQNAKGVVVARDVDELHTGNNIDRETALTEKGDRVLARRTPRRARISTTW